MAYRSRDDLYSHVLTNEQVEDMISKWRQGHTVKSLAQDYEVHENTITNIITRYIQANRRG
jgi:Mor family transcriptional regulator